RFGVDVRENFIGFLLDWADTNPPAFDRVDRGMGDLRLSITHEFGADIAHFCQSLLEDRFFFNEFVENFTSYRRIEARSRQDPAYPIADLSERIVRRVLSEGAVPEAKNHLRALIRDHPDRSGRLTQEFGFLLHSADLTDTGARFDLSAH